MSNKIGEFGFRYGGVIYHSNQKYALKSQQKEIAESFRYDIDEFRESYPIMEVDTETFQTLTKDYDEEFLDNSIIKFM